MLLRARSTSLTGIAIALTLVACKDKAKPYEVRGFMADEMGDTTVIIDGVEIKERAGPGAGFVLPASVNPKTIKTIAFRYQTPCGPHDVPQKLAPIEKHMEVLRFIEAKPASDGGYLFEHLVIVDAGGQDKVDVQIGKQALGKPTDADRRHTASDGWDKLHLGHIFGTECGAEHVVTAARPRTRGPRC
jgi:hypothetical protein